MAITDDKSYEMDILVQQELIWTRICHYLNPFKIARAIQQCRCDLAGMII